ncbi:MAG TPA: hypothetical protein VK943_17105, partial [Arenibaculum sp.]|nr:hypothetical protein [Arenibaculum sp.]
MSFEAGEIGTGAARRSAIGRGTAGMVAVFGVILSLMLFVLVRQQVSAQSDEQVSYSAARATEAVQRRLDLAVDATTAVAALFAVSEVGRNEFAAFVDRMIPAGSEMEAVVWCAGAGRGACTARHVGAGAGTGDEPGIGIDLPPDGSLPEAIVPLLAELEAAGPRTVAALLDGAAFGRAGEDLVAVAVSGMEPDASPAANPGGRLGGGVAVGFADARRIFSEPVDPSGTPRLVGIAVVDPADPGAAPLYERVDVGNGAILGVGSAVPGSVTAGSRSWTLQWRSSFAAMPVALALSPLAVLFGGMTMTGAITGYLILARRRSDEVAQLAASLAAANAELSERERKYRDIYENAVEGVFQTSPAGAM